MKIDHDLLNVDHWPIMITYSIPDMTPERLEAHLKTVQAIYNDNKTPYVLIVDARNGRKPNPEERKILNAFREQNKGHLRQYCLGIGIVFKSALLQGVLTAMYWIVRPNTETKVFTEYEKAIAWAEARLGQ